MSDRETFIATMRAQGCPDHWAFQDDGTGGFHNQLIEWAWIGWNRAIESQAAHIAALTAERDALLGLLVEWQEGLYDGPDFTRRVKLAIHGGKGLALAAIKGQTP